MAPLAATIQLMSGHGAQPRSNQGWFLRREENRRKTLEARERTNKLNSHMMPGPGIEPLHVCVFCTAIGDPPNVILASHKQILAAVSLHLSFLLFLN